GGEVLGGEGEGEVGDWGGNAGPVTGGGLDSVPGSAKVGDGHIPRHRRCALKLLKDGLDADTPEPAVAVADVVTVILVVPKSIGEYAAIAFFAEKTSD